MKTTKMEKQEPTFGRCFICRTFQGHLIITQFLFTAKNIKIVVAGKKKMCVCASVCDSDSVAYNENKFH